MLVVTSLQTAAARLAILKSGSSDFFWKQSFAFIARRKRFILLRSPEICHPTISIALIQSLGLYFMQSIRTAGPGSLSEHRTAPVGKGSDLRCTARKCEYFCSKK